MRSRLPYFNTTLRNLEYRLRKFSDNVPKMLEGIVRSKEDEIVEMVQTQLQMGYNGDEEFIDDYMPYTPYTVKRKKQKGQPWTKVTLKDTGAFYKGMHIVFDEGGFYVTSSDGKTEDLKEKYKPTIFRLANDNLSELLTDHIREEFIRRIKG